MLEAWLDQFFKIVTMLGDEEYYMITIPLLYWLYDKTFGFRFALFFLLSAYTNSAIKFNFATERPSLELRKIVQEGFSFPSGHAQGNTAFWGYLAYQWGRRWGYILAGVIIALVAYSRVYLRVHYPIDIVFGIGVGLVLLALYEFVLRRIRLESFRESTWLLLSAGVIFLLLLNHSQGDGPLTMGFALGLVWGYWAERKYVQLQVRAQWWQHLLKAGIGLGVFFGLRIVLKQLLPVALDFPPGFDMTFLLVFLRYSIMGLWAALGAPWVFKTLRLYRS